jgi:C-terminal processing protease CtpA/Prc
MTMQHSLILSTAAAALFGAVSGMPVAIAQSDEDVAAQNAARAQLETEREGVQAREAQRQVEQTETGNRDLEREIDRARTELESAAREVARLSGQIVEPVVRDVERRFRYTGQRAMLGVNIEDTERGARIAGVSPSGPAAEAGIKVGDTIIALDGAELGSPRGAGGVQQSPTELLLAQMANVDPGEDVKLRVLAENGDERDVTVEARQLTAQVFLRALPSPGAALKGDGHTFSFNEPSSWRVYLEGRGDLWSEMQLVTLTPALGAYFGTTTGLLVVRGPGVDSLRLQDGDVILDIGGREPTTPEHALRILSSFQEGEALKITVMRKQRRETLEFQMPAASAGRG